MNPLSPRLLVLVALGGAAGSVVRHLAGAWLLRATGAGYPWGTLAVNLAGSALIGVAGGAAAAGAPLSAEARLLLVTGFLGGFTTFSSFTLDTGALWERAPLLAAGYVAASVAGGLACFALAFLAARRSF